MAAVTVGAIDDGGTPNDPGDADRIARGLDPLGEDNRAIVDRQMAARQRAPNFRIFASDVHRKSLEIAAEGIYAEASLAELSEAVGVVFVVNPEIQVRPPHRTRRDRAAGDAAHPRQCLPVEDVEDRQRRQQARQPMDDLIKRRLRRTPPWWRW